MMTDEQLATLARHAEQAPPGPWAAEKRQYDWGIYANGLGILLRTSRVNYAEDQEEPLALLAAAAPELLAEVVRLRRVYAAARELRDLLTADIREPFSRFNDAAYKLQAALFVALDTSEAATP